jgi:hypothetical protein
MEGDREGEMQPVHIQSFFHATASQPLSARGILIL